VRQAAPRLAYLIPDHHNPTGLNLPAAERERLVARGLERARDFRWDNVADATVGVYREAAA
jgi:DNA-binding transcriptional MocR family regulator